MPGESITGDLVEVNAGVRQMGASGDFTPKRVDHYTIRMDGQEHRVTSYREVDDPVPKRGETIRGELFGVDKWDGNRRKFRPAGTRAQQQTLGPPGKPAESGISAEQTKRMWAIAQAQRYLDLVSAGTSTDLDVIAKVADAFEQLLAGEVPVSDVPFDDNGLAPANRPELTSEGA